MIQFEASIDRFAENGEKTGWTFVLLSKEQAEAVKPNNKKSFRVKGKIDEVFISQLAVMPMGHGEFILPIKKELQRKLKKQLGERIILNIEEDTSEMQLDADFADCLADDELANTNFEKYSNAEKRYFNNWIINAKTIPTKSKRIAHCLDAFTKQWNYGEMIRANKNKTL